MTDRRRCLVTGGCGFIGSQAVCQLAAADDWEVAVLAFPGESTARIADALPSVRVFEVDLADAARVGMILEEWHPHTCLHTAWYAEPGKYLDSTRNIDCMQHSLALLEALIDAGCRRTVMVGSCAEYETGTGCLRETDPLRPATLYGAAKLATSVVAERRAAQAGMEFAWARLFYLFGPGEDERRMAPSLIRALLAGEQFQATAGDQVRDYLHVFDAAGGLVHLMNSDVSGTYNVCSGFAVRVRELMEAIGVETGGADLIRFGVAPHRQWEPPFICGDPARLRESGWKPRYDLRGAVRATVDYWRRRNEEQQR